MHEECRKAEKNGDNRQDVAERVGKSADAVRKFCERNGYRLKHNGLGGTRRGAGRPKGSKNKDPMLEQQRIDQAANSAEVGIRKHTYVGSGDYYRYAGSAYRVKERGGYECVYEQVGLPKSI